MQVLEHGVDNLAVHWTYTHHKERFVSRLIAKIKFAWVPIIRKAVCLKAITQPLEFTATSLVLTITVYLQGLLIIQKLFPRFSCLPPDPDVTQPTEELINLEVGALVFWRRRRQWILACKKVPEGRVLLLISHSHNRSDLVVTVHLLLQLRLHLLG